jgi:hypothetical protein
MTKSRGNILVRNVCIMEFMKTFADLLTRHFIKLQQEMGRLVRQRELVDLLDVGETTLNLAWNNKRPPSKILVEKCAVYFNDPEFYDAAGMERPEPLLEYTRRNWRSVPDETKRRIATTIAEYTNEPVPGEQGTETSKLS